MNMPLVLLNRRRRGGSFSPYSLFSSTAIGIWLDPSDVANLTWRRNLLTYSEQFDNAAWVKVGVTVPSTTSTAPDGTATADKAVATNTASGTRALYQNFTAPSTTTYTLTVYAKAAEYSLLALQEISGGRFGASFDLTANSSTSLGGAGYVTSSITPVGNSWFRCAVVWTGVAAAGYAITTVGYPSGTTPSAAGTSYAGDGTSGILIWGAQLELGTSATDYQRISDVNTEVIERFPTATMYQDAAGTTPVTTPGQPVGLRLDKSKGLVLGAELVANGDFANGSTGWTLGALWTVSDAQLVGSNVASGTYATSSSFTVVTGTFYRVTLTTTVTSGSFSVRFDNGGTETVLGTVSTSGSHTFYVAAPDASSVVGLRALASGFTGTVDNISVRELPGNHATQSVLASRPVYGIEPAGGRRNLLTYSEDYSNVIWSKTRASISNLTTITATETNASGSWVGQTATGAVGTQVFSSIVSKNTGYVMLTAGSSSLNTDNVRVWFDTDAGTIGTSEANGTGFSVVSTSVADAGANWRVAVVYSATTAAQFQRFYLVNANSSLSVTIGRSASFPGAQLELGSADTPYQRVTTAFDVTEAGVQTCHYVQYDGSDDGMITNSIDFTATDKMSVFAGVRKLSDSPVALFLETSASFTANPGSIGIFAPNSAGTYRLGATGSTTAYYVPSGFPAPITNVISLIADISATGVEAQVVPRINGVIAQSGLVGTGLGTGNFGNYPLYLGRRAGASIPFNGRDYGIVVVGKATTADEIASTERWLAGKTGFYAPIITGVPTIGVS